MAIYTAKKARRALFDTVTFRAISQIATALGFIVFVRAMPEEDFGVFQLLYAFIPVISTVASLGLEPTLRRYQPEYLSAGNVAAARWLVRFVASARFGTNVIVLAVVLLTWNSVAPIFKLAPYREEFAFFSLLVLLHFQARVLDMSLGANMLHRFSVGGIALLSIVKLATYSMLAWHDALHLRTAILADTVAFAIAYLFLLGAYRTKCPSPATPAYRPDKTQRRRLLRYGMFNNFNDVGTMVLGTKADNFFIAAFIDPLGVAVYAFYTRLSQMFARLQPLRLFSNVVHPLFFAVKPSEADDRIPRYYSFLLNTTLLMQVPALAFSIAYHRELVAVVFGGKFGAYSWMLPAIVAFATANSFATPATMVAQYEERAGIILASKVFAVYNVVALLVLLPIAGVYGAVLATGSATFLKNLFIWWFARGRARWLNAGAMISASALVWGSVLALCYALKTFTTLADVGDIFLGVLVFSVGFLIYIRTPTLSTSDRAILALALHGRENRLLRRIGLLPTKSKSAP